MEEIYYVDENDTPTGEVSEKFKAHNSKTRLHAAFSCYVFNEKGEFLVTQRAKIKKVWPGVWTNSFCGHPMPGESRENAIIRRADFELGIKVERVALVVPKYIYKTPPYNGIIEHEYCPIYIAMINSKLAVNSNEVENYKWVDWSWYVNQLESDNNDYSNPSSPNAPIWSWWCKDQLKELSKNTELKKLI